MNEYWAHSPNEYKRELTLAAPIHAKHVFTLIESRCVFVCIVSLQWLPCMFTVSLAVTKKVSTCRCFLAAKIDKKKKNISERSKQQSHRSHNITSCSIRMHILCMAIVHVLQKREHASVSSQIIWSNSIKKTVIVSWPWDHFCFNVFYLHSKDNTDQNLCFTNYLLVNRSPISGVTWVAFSA